MSQSFQKDSVIRPTDENFSVGLQAVVDYRGDSTIVLKSGEAVVGYIFSASQNSVDLFEQATGKKTAIGISLISEIQFSGEDTALGKSWEEWSKKKAMKQEGAKEAHA